MKTELISLTYSENRAVLLNFLWPILTPHAQVVWLQERYSLLMVINKHVTLKWSSSDSGLKNLWRVLYGVSCTWLPMADSICWMHLLSLGLPTAAFRKLRERQIQSTPFIFIFLQTYDTYERKKVQFWWRCLKNKITTAAMCFSGLDYFVIQCI